MAVLWTDRQASQDSGLARPDVSRSSSLEASQQPGSTRQPEADSRFGLTPTLAHGTNPL
jgi:hypothetical protein